MKAEFHRRLWWATISFGLALAGGFAVLNHFGGPWLVGAIAASGAVAVLAALAARWSEQVSQVQQAIADDDLRKSQERLDDFANTASDWLWELNAELRFTYASDRFYELSGMSSSDFIGRRHDWFVENDPDNEELPQFLEALEARRPFRHFIFSEPVKTVEQGVGKSSERRWFRLSGTPKFAADGEFLGYRGTGTEITAEVQAREEAVESTVRFLDAIENVSDGIAFWDADDRFVLCNRRFRDQAGKAASTLVQGNNYEAHIRAILHHLPKPVAEEDREAWVARRIEEHQNPPNAVEVYREGRWLLIRDDRSPDGSIVTVTTDITGVKEREQELQGILDTVPMLLGYVDKARCYQLINRTFEEWFTVDRNQIRGMPLSDVHEPRLMQLMTYYMDAALGGREVRFEASIPYAGVSTVPGYRGNRQIELIFTPNVIAGGGIDGFFVAASDVTQRMLDTAQLHQSQKMEAVGQLTGGVAHDFNNLLAVIVGSLALLEEKVGEGRERKLVDAALRSARRGADLTQRLLAFGRRQALMTEIVDANELVDGLTELLRRTLGVGIEIQTQLGSDLWQMNVDRGQLENALLNLSINARDAMPGGGTLNIETANMTLDQAYTDQIENLDPGNFVMIAVADTGGGMTDEVRERAVEPFFTTKETGQGSGLGLSMIYGFTKQSGGHMRLYSEPGQGTVVRLYLPVSEIDPAERERSVATVERLGSQGERILVIEDDPEVRVTTVAMLETLGYETLEAETGQKAIEIVDSGADFDLLFTDVFLTGGMNGPEAAREIKSRRAHMPVLFTSGYSADQITQDDSLDDGVKMIAKPFELAALARKIRECLGE